MTKQICSDFEVLEYKNATINEIRENLIPITETLCRFNPVRFLFCVGQADFVSKNKDLDGIKNDVQRLKNDLTTMGTVSVHFIEIPFFPCVSKFPRDKYNIPLDKTASLFSNNLWIRDMNTEHSYPYDNTPSLSSDGISKEPWGNILFGTSM